MVATTPAVDLALLQSNFRLQETLGDDCCVNPQDHAELDACVMNPIFVKSAGALLAGQWSCKSYEICGRACLPDINDNTIFYAYGTVCNCCKRPCSGVHAHTLQPWSVCSTCSVPAVSRPVVLALIAREACVMQYSDA